MTVRKAALSDFEAIKQTVRETIIAIYPRYYPAGAVEFFHNHHSDENITLDISAGQVYTVDHDSVICGTVTVTENEISRLFVLPDYQGRGCGKALLDYAEQLIFLSSETIQLASSYPSKCLYLKRGYKEISFNTIVTENGDCLCYDMMQKKR